MQLNPSKQTPNITKKKVGFPVPIWNTCQHIPTEHPENVARTGGAYDPLKARRRVKDTRCVGQNLGEAGWYPKP